METVPLDFLEENVMCVASKISGAAEALGVEAIELNSWILCFWYTVDEFGVFVADLADWMTSSSPP